MLSSILGGLATGLVGLVGGSMQNQANANQAAQANNFSAAQTAAQMDFQREMWGHSRDYNTSMAFQSADWANRSQDKSIAFMNDMSNTAYQRAMNDMRQAGLNPILAYQQGGASTPNVGNVSPGGASISAPGGASARGQQARMENVLGPAVGSALQAAQTVQQLDNLQANVDQTRAQTRLIAANERNVDVNTGLQTAQAITEGVRPELLRSEIGRNRASAADLSNSATRRDLENRDYRDYGPPNTLRDQAITGGRIGAGTVAPIVRGLGERLSGAWREGTPQGQALGFLQRLYERLR